MTLKERRILYGVPDHFPRVFRAVAAEPQSDRILLVEQLILALRRNKMSPAVGR
ncbi:MAG TPA: hypothetical protein VG055_04385 [Planctomycetaceae bacterium]|nr:hypothetical protein [Planctomycetaceae bacterium]